MTFAKNDLFCDPHPPTYPAPLSFSKINNRSLFKNKIICKKVTNFKTPPTPPSMWTSSIYGPLCVCCDMNFFSCFFLNETSQSSKYFLKPLKSYQTT